MTCLPFGFAPLMGLTANDLAPQQGQQVGGEMTFYRAQAPCTGHVAGLPEPTFEIWPVFVPGSQIALWGRADFFRTFGVSFDEVAQQFTLNPRDDQGDAASARLG